MPDVTSAYLPSAEQFFPPVLDVSNSAILYSHGTAGAMSAPVQASPLFPDGGPIPQGFDCAVFMLMGYPYVAFMIYAEGLPEGLPSDGVLFMLLRIDRDIPVAESSHIDQWLTQWTGSSA